MSPKAKDVADIGDAENDMTGSRKVKDNMTKVVKADQNITDNSFNPKIHQYCHVCKKNFREEMLMVDGWPVVNYTKCGHDTFECTECEEPWKTQS